VLEAGKNEKYNKSKARKSRSGRRRQNGWEIYENLGRKGREIIEADPLCWPNTGCGKLTSFFWIWNVLWKRKLACRTLYILCHMDVDVHIQLGQKYSLRQLHAWHDGTLRHGGLNSSFSHSIIKKKTPWSESASELYLPSDRRLSAKGLPTFVDRGCHVVSVTDPYGRNLGFIDRRRYFSIK
jgi:hypothetical protein